MFRTADAWCNSRANRDPIPVAEAGSAGGRATVVDPEEGERNDEYSLTAPPVLTCCRWNVLGI